MFKFLIQQQGNRLIISNANYQDNGRYICICHSENGQQYTAAYDLNIENEPASQHAVLTPKTEHAEIGSEIRLSCNSDRYPARFEWTRTHGKFSPGQEINSVSTQMNIICFNLIDFCFHQNLIKLIYFYDS